MKLQWLIDEARRRAGRVKAVRRVRDDLDLLVKYRTLRPERVPLADSSHVIFANPREPRGRAILRGYGSGQRRLKSIWRRAIQRLAPTIVLDVGANYGEFLFFTDYPADALVIGVEADPQLMRYLEKSKDAHGQAGQIELVCALAAAQPGQSVPFYVDTQWSGRSSALRQARHGQNTRVEMVPTTSVDALLDGRATKEDRLVFKIDVEGFEPHVLEGMAKAIERVHAAVGIMEFNTSFLRKTGLDPDEYLARLRARFVVSLLEGNEPPRDLTHGSLRDLVGERDIVADVVVATLDHSLLPGLRPPVN